ncbi:hypothetical protein EH223_03865 [candidate division KSB1 bacterium]|nr:hypothetical protein [candidate division KSB1 bacterium]RQW05734.1 MAG: hypothetical protein EH223_03865 [candidate division KSB1 bacterium]
MALPLKYYNSSHGSSISQLPFMRLMFWTFLILSIIVLQLAFGADVRILFFAVATALCGFLILNHGGIYDAVSLAGFVFLFNTVFFAILLKTFLGQAIDSNLYAPFISFLIIFIVALEVLFAIKLVHIIPVGKPLYKPHNDLSFLKYLAIVCYVLGVLLWILSQLYHVDPRSQFSSQDKGFGGFATIYPIFYMGIVAGTAFVLLSSNQKKSVNKWLFMMILTGVIMGLFESRKVIVGLTFGYYFFTSFIYRHRITSRQIFVGILLVLFIFFIFAPIVHVYRTDLWFLPFSQRIDYMKSNADKMIQSNYLFDYFRRVFNQEYSLNSYQYFGQNLILIDRFATIQHSDLIIDSFMSRNEMGAELFIQGFDLILPSFINPNKRSISLGDQITWELGLRKYGVVGFPTVPVIASSFAAKKWLGVLVVPFFIFLLLFLFLKKVGADIRRNVFSIYFIVPILVGAHEWSHSQYIVRLFRLFPVQIILLLLIVFFYHKVRAISIRKSTLL